MLAVRIADHFPIRSVALIHTGEHGVLLQLSSAHKMPAKCAAAKRNFC
jgi:hypothetical protein